MAHLTVGDLVDIEQFDCQLLAGSAGLGRPVVWAHSCELDDPWRWLGADELLMTVGLCVPPDAPDQQNLIQQLHRAGLAGLAIGDDLKAPPLTSELLSTADELGFPVLLVGHTTPFATIGRTVAIAGQSDQLRRLARVSRLYEVARTSTFGDESLLRRLSSELGHQLHVLDVALGSEVMRQDQPLDQEVVDEIVRSTAGRLDRLPARLVIEGPDQTLATALALSTHRPCMLVAQGPKDLDDDLFLLLHVQSLASVEVGRIATERDQKQARGNELLDRLIDGSLGDEAGAMALESFGLAGPRYVLAFKQQTQSLVITLLDDAEVPNLTGLARGGDVVAVVPAKCLDGVVGLLRGRVPHIGVSACATSIGQVADSTRQARWALQAAESSNQEVADYETAAPIMLPRTVADAEFITRMVLGPLLDHDRQHDSDLVNTLEVFLEANKSWQAAAATLCIHRQTLGYRIRQVEALTGKSLRSTPDVATLWMALLARRFSNE